MFDGFLKPKFYTKCKTSVKLIKVRLDGIRRKRTAVQGYLKNDIADLLKSNQDIYAYGKAEGLLIEQNMSSCYDFIERFCEPISNHLSVMHKQRECPEECREAVPSLMYAAARIADLPELRDLRTLFTEKYGNSLDSFINKEFVEKLKSKPPTKEMKLQLMQDIAQEISIEWDSKALEQKLFKPPPPEQGKPKCGSLQDTATEEDIFPKRDSLDARNKVSDAWEYTVPKSNDRDYSSRGRKNFADDKDRLRRSSEDEVTAGPRRDGTYQDGQQTSSSAVGSVPEDEAESRKPFYYRFIPPPYTKTKVGKEGSKIESSRKSNGNADVEIDNHQGDLVGDSKPKPRSVRRRNLKPPPGRDNVGVVESDKVAKIDSSGMKPDEARQGSHSTPTNDGDGRDEEEKEMDALLMHYSKKQSPYDLSKAKANLKPPPSQQITDDIGESARHRCTNSEVAVQPARAVSLPPEPTTSTQPTKGHVRATSLQPDMMAGHVHPKLPDYDEFAAQFAALKRR